MKSENPTLRRVAGEVTAAGEIASATAGTITITGMFGGGIAVPLRPGARVFVLTEDDVLDLFGGKP